MPHSVLRICVGSGGASRSTVWKLWTHNDNAYIQSRMMRSVAKVSFHGSGLAQWSRTDEWVRGTGARNRDRHIERWNFPQPSPREPRSSSASLPPTANCNLWAQLVGQTESRGSRAQRPDMRESLSVTSLHGRPPTYLTRSPPTSLSVPFHCSQTDHSSSLPMRTRSPTTTLTCFTGPGKISFDRPRLLASPSRTELGPSPSS